MYTYTYIYIYTYVYTYISRQPSKFLIWKVIVVIVITITIIIINIIIITTIITLIFIITIISIIDIIIICRWTSAAISEVSTSGAQSTYIYIYIYRLQSAVRHIVHCEHMALGKNTSRPPWGTQIIIIKYL